MGQQWYYADGNRVLGPYSEAELLELARSGRITPKTRVALAGGTAWTEAERIDSLFGSQSAAPLAGAPSQSSAVPNWPSAADDPYRKSAARSPALGSTAIAFVTAGLLGVAVIVLLLVLLLRGNHAAVAPVQKPLVTASPPPAQEEEANRNIQALDEEKVKLSKELDGLRSEKQSLENQKKKLDEELRDLSSQIQQLKKWGTARFAMVNAAHFAVGLETTPENDFRVVVKSADRTAARAMQFARKRHIPRIGNDRDLARILYHQCNEGDIVEKKLADEIRKYWKPQSYAPCKPSETPTFVSFKDLNAQHSRRIGFLLDTDAATNSLFYWPVGAEKQTVERAMVQPGSDRVGSGADILKIVSGADFLDYCVLNIAQKLGTENDPGHRHVAVKINLDVREEEIQLSKQADDRRFDRWFEAMARLTGREWQGDLRKEAARFMREAQLRVEEELNHKLTKMGLSVLEREHLRDAQAERELAGDRNQDDLGFEDRDFGNLAVATHQVVADLAPPTDPSQEFTIGVRLVDLDTGQRIWSEMGFRPGKAKETTTQYLLQSGKLALVTLKAGAEAETFHNLEDARVILPWKTPSKFSKHLVHVEGKDDNSTLLYRPLFDKKTYEFRRELIESIEYPPDPTAVVRSQPEHFRCIVWRIAKALLPPAARVRLEGSKYVVEMGRAAGVNEQSRFRVVRTGGSSSPQLLPIELAVADPHDTDCDVEIVKTRLTSLWPEAASLQSGDVAVLDQTTLSSIVVEAPRIVPPSPKVQREIPRFAQRQNGLALMTLQAAQRLQNRLEVAFRHLGIDVVHLGDHGHGGAGGGHVHLGTNANDDGDVHVEGNINSERDSRPGIEAHASHRISGEITIINQKTLKVTLDVDSETQEHLDNISFEVVDSWLE